MEPVVRRVTSERLEMEKKDKPKNWYCCGLLRGMAELQCPLCRKLQPKVRVPAEALLLKN